MLSKMWCILSNPAHLTWLHLFIYKWRVTSDTTESLLQFQASHLQPQIYKMYHIRGERRSKSSSLVVLICLHCHFETWDCVSRSENPLHFMSSCATAVFNTERAPGHLASAQQTTVFSFSGTPFRWYEMFNSGHKINGAWNVGWSAAGS